MLPETNGIKGEGTCWVRGRVVVTKVPGDWQSTGHMAQSPGVIRRTG